MRQGINSLPDYRAVERSGDRAVERSNYGLSDDRTIELLDYRMIDRTVGMSTYRTAKTIPHKCQYLEARSGYIPNRSRLFFPTLIARMSQT